MIKRYIVDIGTHNANLMFQKINGLSTTVKCHEPRVYDLCPEYSLIGFESSQTKDDIVNWLHKLTDIGYWDISESPE